jgi:hypothetical protein
MYRLPILLILFHSFTATAQKNESPSGKDSCIVLLDIFSNKSIDSSNMRIEKAPVKDLIKRIKDCGNGYKYDSGYQDKAFEISVPKYLKNRYYTFGDYNFCFNFYDTASKDNSTDRAIVVYYDFDSSYRRFLLNEIAAGRRTVIADKATGREMYLNVDVDDKFCGQLFSENNTIIFYCTRDKRFEQELQRSILNFRWK